MKFLQRLRNSKGTLDTSKLEEFEKQQNSYLKNISEGPLQFNQVRSTSVARNAENQRFLHQNFISPQNVTNYSKNPTSTSSTTRYQPNKDFSSGLRLPQTKYTINDSFETGRFDKSADVSQNDRVSLQKEDSNLEKDRVVVKKRYRTRPRNRKKDEINPYENISQAYESAEYSFDEEKVLFKTMVNADNNIRMNLEITRKGRKVYIKASNVKHQLSSEVELHLKQATKLLMTFNNDFEAFIRECILFKAGKLILRDLNKVRYSSVSPSIHETESIVPKMQIQIPQMILSNDVIRQIKRPQIQSQGKFSLQTDHRYQYEKKESNITTTNYEVSSNNENRFLLPMEEDADIDESAVDEKQEFTL